MKFMMETVEVNEETVDVVKEWGYCIYCTPGDDNGRRVAGTSLQAFGSDFNRASESKSRWVAAARAWW